jgi:hypothetical protein
MAAGGAGGAARAGGVYGGWLIGMTGWRMAGGVAGLAARRVPGGLWRMVDRDDGLAGAMGAGGAGGTARDGGFMEDG